MKLEAGNRVGERIDTFVAGKTGLTRSAVQKLIEEGCLTLRGMPVKKNYRLVGEEVFELELPEVRERGLEAEDICLDIVYEDSDVVIVNKPRGMVVHPAAGHESGTLVNALMYHCGDSLSGINGEYRPGIVHRIDKDTSGLLIVAKNDMAHVSLAEQIKEHSCYREYEAIVCGNLREDSGTVDAPVGRHPTYRKKMAVIRDGRHVARNAVTHWEVIARFPGSAQSQAYTHIRCMLETGRTHQIRVHMAYIGHPVAGDAVYGGKDEFGLGGQCLHAKKLVFTHPRTGERMTCECELPEYFRKVLTILEKRV